MSTTTRLVPMTAVWALALATAFLATPVRAQVRYTDSEGVSHWVDSIDRVPEPYRKQAVNAPARSRPAMTNPGDWKQKAREIDRRDEQAAQEAKRQEMLGRKREELAQRQQAWDQAVQSCASGTSDPRFSA